MFTFSKGLSRKKEQICNTCGLTEADQNIEGKRRVEKGIYSLRLLYALSLSDLYPLCYKHSASLELNKVFI